MSGFTTAMLPAHAAFLQENYTPISVLDVFSKVFERFILNQMTPYLNDMLSVFLSAYRQITVANTFYYALSKCGVHVWMTIKSWGQF